MTTRDELARAAQADAAGADTRFPAYLFTHGAWFLAFGLQMVLFPYLVRVVLQENEIRFGLAQMALQAPTTVLILLGGFLADRRDGRRIVIVCALATMVTFAVLGGFVAGGQLTYGLVIAYALVVGSISAFSNPARDSLLSQVAPDPGNVQRAVAAASMAQFAAQILGMVAAMVAPLVGVAALLFGQSGLMAASALAALGMRPRPTVARPPGLGHPLAVVGRDIREGFSAVIASPVIGPVMLCSVGMGVCFMGAFAVLLPLVVQNYFPLEAGGRANAAIATALGAFSLCFWVGSMVSAMVIMRRPPRRKGRAYLLALASGALVLLVCVTPMPLWLLCVMNFLWGLGGGVAMTLSRGLVQEHAPADRRARVLSIFTLGIMGGGPLGAVAYGVLAHEIGPRVSLLVPSLLMLAIVGTVARRSQLRHLGAVPA
ncbi:MAG: MFS transporter [Phenylobacterium sp.]|nr:MFS transporter [Phenylobacterium sp.]